MDINNEVKIFGFGFGRICTLSFGSVSAPWRLYIFGFGRNWKKRFRSTSSYVADHLGWPVTILNYTNFYILRCLLHLCNWWSQRLQIWCRGWMCKSQPQTVSDRGVVRSCDSLKILAAPSISLEWLNLKSSNFVHRQAISILATGWHITNNRGVVMVTWLF